MPARRVPPRLRGGPPAWPCRPAWWIGLAALAGTAEAAQTLADCAAIGPAADRLACYDRLAGRAPPDLPNALPAAATSAGGAAPSSTSELAQKDVPVPAGRAEPGGSGSLMSKFWELDPQDKRGIFNFVGYRPNYILPLHLTTHVNRAPQSPTQKVVLQPDYRNAEAKFQLSLRTKVLQDVLLPGGDLWLAFTQQALWQIWNSKDSKPFRNSDYEPEAIFVVPTPEAWRALPFDWQWRYAQFGLAHQSNGQSDPLSRSWNRVYLGAGFERGDWSFSTRFKQRLNEPYATDNNPDLVHFRGRGEFQFNWASGPATASLLYRSTLRNARFGALQFEWSYPLVREQPNGLRWFVQVFHGYGETLTDYNFRQTSLGAGVSFVQF
jgi:phospholipase A1